MYGIAMSPISTPTRIGRRVACLAVLVACGCMVASVARAGIAFKADYVFPELFPLSMQKAFDYAANDILAEELAIRYEGENVAVRIRWRELGWPGPYATTRIQVLRNFNAKDPDYKADTYYPTALANHLLQDDRSIDSDILLTLNVSSILDGKLTWYLGTDGKTPDKQLDYVTLILHELVHGLGFFSTIVADGSYSDVDPPGAMIYDRFVVGLTFDENGKPRKALPLVDMQSDEDRARAIRWPELMWSGAQGQKGADSDILFLYAPKEFNDSASVSHLDPRFPSLMNPAYLGPNHVVDRTTLGMLADIGWTVRETVPEPGSISLMLLGLCCVWLSGLRGRQ